MFIVIRRTAQATMSSEVLMAMAKSIFRLGGFTFEVIRHAVPLEDMRQADWVFEVKKNRYDL